jgi:hypothetical protein
MGEKIGFLRDLRSLFLLYPWICAPHENRCIHDPQRTDISAVIDEFQSTAG